MLLSAGFRREARRTPAILVHPSHDFVAAPSRTEDDETLGVTRRTGAETPENRRQGPVLRTLHNVRAGLHPKHGKD